LNSNQRASRQIREKRQDRTLIATGPVRLPLKTYLREQTGTFSPAPENWRKCWRFSLYQQLARFLL
jgi:hypothetical protein